MNQKISLFAFSALVLTLSLSGADMVRNGKAKASIVLAPDAGFVEKHAAEELAFFIKKKTGAVLSIGQAPVPGLLPVRIGRSSSVLFQNMPQIANAAKKQKEDAVGIYSGKDGIAFFSVTDRGLLYSVYHALKKYGGIYFLYPGEEGEIIPKSGNFAIPDGIETKNPAFRIRHFALNGGSGWTPETYDWLLRNGLTMRAVGYTHSITSNDERSIYQKKRAVNYSEGGHVMGNLLVGYAKGRYLDNMYALLKEHPEYFGLLKGKRTPAGNEVRPHACQPCTSNPAVLQRMSKNCLERIALYQGKPLTRSFCNDDHNNWCECAECRKLDDPREQTGMNKRSTRWWHFVNYMAKAILDNPEVKNVSVTTLAYQAFRLPPMGIKPDKRVTVTLCPHGRCYIHSLDDPECRVNAGSFLPLFEAWHKAGMQIDTFEYHPETPGITNYLFNDEAWIRDLKYYHRIHAAGFGMVTNAPNGTYNNRYTRSRPGRRYACLNRWMSAWQRHWLTGYFAWNIDDDYHKVSDKINSLYYGKAWSVMKEYRAFLNKAILDSRVDMVYGSPDTILGKCCDRPGLVRRAHELLDKAEKAAGNDKLLLKRIALDREYFRKNWEDSLELYNATKQKEYNAKRRTGRIVIDGKLEENDWKEATFDNTFHKFTGGNAGRIKADPQTYVRILYDNENLYFGIESMKAAPGIKGKKAEENGLKVFNASHVEIFITPPQLNGKYYQLAYSIDGKLYQALTLGGSSHDQTVKVNPEYKIIDLPEKWVLETRIPLKTLKLRIVDGSVWKINVARSAAGRDGKAVSSSWSNGVFHGSDVHRNVAFGIGGALLRNGDMEDTEKLTAKKRNKWIIVNDRIPSFIAFNNTNYGKAEIRTDSPFSGKNYLRVSGKSAFIDCYLNEKENRNVRLSVTFAARGTGELLPAVRSDGKYFYAANKVIKLSGPDQWRKYSLLIEVPARKKNMKIRRAMTFRISGTADLDNIQVFALPEEEIPDAAKH